MIDIEETEIDRKILINELCKFLKIEKPILQSDTNKETIKELCVARLCKSVGLSCEYNYKSEFFEFFSSITGEAIADKLNINIRIADDCLRLFKYEHKNLITEVRNFLENDSIDEAFLDAFNFIDSYKYLIPIIKNKKV